MSRSAPPLDGGGTSSWGPYNCPESRYGYERVLAEFRSRDNNPTTAEPITTAGVRARNGDATVNELLLRYLRYAD